MHANLTEPDILNIGELLSKDKYIVPLYQRAYAWTKTEIDQLLADVLEKSEQTPVRDYYIGSLVIAPATNGYEIVDGQQRHTTLTLINIVINHLFDNPNYAGKKINLYFEGRSASSALLLEYAGNFDKAKSVEARPEKVQTLTAGFGYILRFFELLLKQRSRTDVEKFAAYIYEHVRIVRILLPSGTNFNRYFEIMNNRGAQLEPHEILKANFLGTLKDYDESTRKAFAVAWDACSQMDQYIQRAFSSNVRHDVFGHDLLFIPQEYMKASVNKQRDRFPDESNMLANILENPARFIPAGNTNNPAEARYRSIINFSNFLLQVLTLHLSDNTVSLDEKKLLTEFGCNQQSRRVLPEAIPFLNDLVYYRTCFDRYVIKREEALEGSGWKILQFKPDGNYVNVFDQPEQLVMLQSMFHVSFPGNNFKNWLQKVLTLFKKESVKAPDQLHKEIELISQGTFDGIHKQLANGTGTPAFLFNYLDLRLWQIYKTLDLGQENSGYVSPRVLKQIGANRQIFKNFRFRQNNSVEHVAPRRPDTDTHHVKNLDSFGNLCLVSRSSNSKYSNATFGSKKEYYQADVEKSRVESLKQVLIFQHDHWKDEDILQHAAEMASILFKEKIMYSLEDLVTLLKTRYPMVAADRQVTNLVTNKTEIVPQPKYLYRGERTVDWKTSPTTFARNLQGKSFFEDVNYLLTGSALHFDFTYQHHSLYQFLRDDLYGIGAVNPPDYPAQIDIELAGIFQHYGFDTCLLDLTADIDIAANFAAMGSPGDVGQIMVLETSSIEDLFFDLQPQPGNRARRQHGYGLWGTPLLDVKSDEFKALYQPVWLKFILTENDKKKYKNDLMLSISGDRVSDSIRSWWNEVGKLDRRAGNEAKEYVERKIAQLT